VTRLGQLGPAQKNKKNKKNKKNMCMRKNKFIFIYLFTGARVGNKKY